MIVGTFTTRYTLRQERNLDTNEIKSVDPNNTWDPPNCADSVCNSAFLTEKLHSELTGAKGPAVSRNKFESRIKDDVHKSGEIASISNGSDENKSKGTEVVSKNNIRNVRREDNGTYVLVDDVIPHSASKCCIDD